MIPIYKKPTTAGRLKMPNSSSFAGFFITFKDT